MEAASARLFNPDVMRAEQSYKFLIELHRTVTQKYKQKSVILDADDLQRDPGSYQNSHTRLSLLRVLLEMIPGEPNSEF